MDGAEFSLAPLTYDEMEEYARRVKATQEKIADLKLPETGAGSARSSRADAG